MRKIHTSFVMAVLNRRPFLENTLKGYCRYAPQEGAELVLADYGSTDGVEDLLGLAKKAFDRVRYLVLDRSKSTIPINPKHNNPAVALNTAIGAAEGGLLIMSPPECYPLADNVKMSQEILKGGQRKAAVFGKALGMPQTAANTMKGGVWLPKNEGETYAKIPEKQFAIWSSKEMGVLRAIPFFMAFRKEDHQTINGFDEEYVRGYGGEDRDYTTRLRLSGVEHLWDDRCVVLHQWHPRTVPGKHGTDPGRPNWKRDGVRANLKHCPGSKDLIAKEVVL